MVSYLFVPSYHACFFWLPFPLYAANNWYRRYWSLITPLSSIWISYVLRRPPPPPANAMSLDTKILLDKMKKLGNRFMSDSWSLSKGKNHRMSADNLFDETTRSDFEEWRSSSCILEVTIHKVCYPIMEYVLQQVFHSFGVVEQVLMFGGRYVVLDQVMFDSKDVAADAYGELHGRMTQEELSYPCCSWIVVRWRPSVYCTKIVKQLLTQAVTPWRVVLPKLFMSCIPHRLVSVHLGHPHCCPRHRP